VAKAGNVVDAINSNPNDEDYLKFMGEIMMIGLPMPLVEQLSNAAKERNLTLAQLLSHALDDYVKKTKPKMEESTSGRRLLTEG
jgi:hypothetical protein